MQRVAVCAVFACALLAQAPDKISPDLRFEVASFKISKTNAPGGGIRPAPGGQRYQAVNCPVKLMIQVIHRVKANQIIGGPDWLDTERYDMEAKAEKSSTGDELHVMLTNLLVDRMKFKFHIEQREMARYGLTVDKDGPKLTAHEADNAGKVWIDITQEKPLHMKLAATSVPMNYFAFRLAQLVDRPVVDLTELKGGYDFTLTYTRELPAGFPAGGLLNGEEPDTSGPNVHEAVKRQLGLELKPGKGPVDVIVIDHVEKPTEN